MKRHLILLLSLCVVSPVMYGSQDVENPAENTFGQGAITTQKVKLGRVKRTWGAVCSASNKVIKTPVAKAGNFIWTKTVDGKNIVKNASIATWTGIKSVPSATWRGIKVTPSVTWKGISSIRDLASFLTRRTWLAIWGQAPQPGYAYAKQDFFGSRVDALRLAMIAQGHAIGNGYAYRRNRTLGLSTVATAIGSAIAYSKFGATGQTVAVGLGAGALTGLVSKLYLDKRAQLGKINGLHDAVVTRALQNGVTAIEAEQAYTQATTGNRRMYAIREFGFNGRSDMRGIRDQIIAKNKNLELLN